MDPTALGELYVAAHTAATNPELVKELTKDLAQPALQKTGKAAAELVEIVAAPITAANMLVRHALKRLGEKLESVPLEKIVHVAPEVGVPIMQRLAYVSDFVLSELYLELLAKAANSDTAGQAHPSFVHAIDRMSPDEGLLLQRLRGRAAFAEALLLGITDPASSHILERFAVASHTNEGLAFPKNLAIYLNNLASLGIVEIIRARAAPGMGMDGQYAEIEAAVRGTATTLPEGWSSRLVFSHGFLHLSPYGELFAQACSIPAINPPPKSSGDKPG